MAATATKQPWTEALEARQEQAMETYRRYVNVVADGEQLSKIDAGQLAESFLLLGLSETTFEGDVAAMKKHRSMKAEKPDPEKEIEDWGAKADALGREIDATTYRLSEMKSQQKHAALMAQIVGNHRATVERIEAENPRVFGPIEDAVHLRHRVIPRDHQPGLMGQIPA